MVSVARSNVFAIIRASNVTFDGMMHSHMMEAPFERGFSFWEDRGKMGNA